MNKRKGISLIVLVITILVMIILAGVVVVSLQKNNPIEKAKEANFKTDVSSFASELGVGLSNSLVENSSVKPEEIFANKFVDMKKYINSFSKKYENKLVIADGKLTYIGGDSKEEKWSKECGIEVFRGVNKPVLSEGMIPIKYENNSWVICSENDPSWYNYEQKLWANVMLSDGKYKDKNLVGTKVTDADLGSMFVWIPRYAYGIREFKKPKNAEGSVQKITDVRFLLGVSNTDEAGTVYKEDYNYSEVEVGTATPKIVHPAFTFGDKKLNGFWMAKFESSMQEQNLNTNESNDNTNKTLKILPNKNTWRNISMRNILSVCMDMSKQGNIYGISNVDTHLVKNIEWGAVAFLSASQYGFTPVLNSEKLEIIQAVKYEAYSGGNNYIANIRQSTTGNVTGIYDMNGGSWDYTAAFYDNNNYNLSLFGGDRFFQNNKLKPEFEKYFDVYKVSSDEVKASQDRIWDLGEEANARRKQMTTEKYNLFKEKKGDAMYEVMQENKFSYYGKKTTGEHGWLTSLSSPTNQYEVVLYNADYALLGNTVAPFVPRGGRFWSGENGGIFAIDSVTGGPYYSYTFRPVITN